MPMEQCNVNISYKEFKKYFVENFLCHFAQKEKYKIKVHKIKKMDKTLTGFSLKIEGSESCVPVYYLELIYNQYIESKMQIDEYLEFTAKEYRKAMSI